MWPGCVDFFRPVTFKYFVSSFTLISGLDFNAIVDNPLESFIFADCREFAHDDVLLRLSGFVEEAQTFEEAVHKALGKSKIKLECLFYLARWFSITCAFSSRTLKSPKAIFLATSMSSPVSSTQCLMCSSAFLCCSSIFLRMSSDNAWKYFLPFEIRFHWPICLFYVHTNECQNKQTNDNFHFRGLWWVLNDADRTTDWYLLANERFIYLRLSDPAVVVMMRGSISKTNRDSYVNIFFLEWLLREQEPIDWRVIWFFFDSWGHLEKRKWYNGTDDTIHSIKWTHRRFIMKQST